MSAAAQQAETLARAGRVAEAYLLLETAIASGDAEAALTLGDWRVSGAIIRRDLGLARDAFGQAAKLGSDDGAEAQLALLASGAGGSGRDWAQALDVLSSRAKRLASARRQLSLIEAMALDDDGNPARPVPQCEAVSSDPQLVLLRQFLTRDECQYLQDIALPRLQPAVVVDPASGRLISDPVRTGSAAAFPLLREDPVIHAINRRIAAATNTRWEQGEPTQVLGYDPGQQYRLHNDTLRHADNQRDQTFLIWLNEGFEGGETQFPKLRLTFKGRAGDALHFVNVHTDCQPHSQTIHAGLPVTRGRKLMLSRWLRRQPLDLTGPPGRPF